MFQHPGLSVTPSPNQRCSLWVYGKRFNAFRFNRSGVVERALEVREIGGGTVKVVSPAAAKFDD